MRISGEGGVRGRSPAEIRATGCLFSRRGGAHLVSAAGPRALVRERDDRDGAAAGALPAAREAAEERLGRGDHRRLGAFVPFGRSKHLHREMSGPTVTPNEGCSCAETAQHRTKDNAVMTSLQV